MNIFVLAENPKIAATYHCDKHVVKMIVETAQLLCNVHHYYDNSLSNLYKKTHINNPCSIWVRSSSDNYKWLSELGLSLCDEYTKRYDKVHKTTELLKFLANNIPLKSNSLGITRFPLVMPDELKIYSENVFNEAINSYRNFYIKDKVRFAKWKNTETPKWFKI